MNGFLLEISDLQSLFCHFYRFIWKNFTQNYFEEKIVSFFASLTD